MYGRNPVPNRAPTGSSIMIVVFNAPPGAGKDTITSIIAGQQPGTIITTFKFGLYQEVAKYYNKPLHIVQKLCGERRTKDAYSEVFGCTPREALIHVSEDVIKPLRGRDYFGTALANRILDLNLANKLILVPDGGFTEEVEPLNDIARLLVVRLYGRGTFANDSRDYLTDDKFNYLDIELVEGNPYIAAHEITRHINGVTKHD